LGGKMREKLIARERLLAVVPQGYLVAADGRVSLRELADLGLVWFPRDRLAKASMRNCSMTSYDDSPATT
jgi:hypothetical protein